mgnify:CR=1 FL=1
MTSQLPLLVDRYRYKRTLYHRLLCQIAEIGDHIMHITEHVHHCSFYRIRTMQYYNEIMRCLETVADECSTVRESISITGVLRLTYNAYHLNQVVMGAIVDKLRYLYRMQGAKQFKHVLDIEFGSNVVMQWWHSFLDTAFIPLSYNVYSIRKNGEVKKHKLSHPFNKSKQLRFVAERDYSKIDTERILKIKETETLDNLCYTVKSPVATSSSLLGEETREKETSINTDSNDSSAPASDWQIDVDDI